MFAKAIFGASLLFSVNVWAESCSTIEQAREGLVRYAALGKYPFSGAYTADSFLALRSMEDSDENFCHQTTEEDCEAPQIDFGMRWSFEPGLRGWIGIDKNCVVDLGITFID